jgi:hypothetical protein
MNPDPALQSGVPYLPAGFVAAGSFYNSPLLAYGDGGVNADGTTNTRSRFLQAGLNINGTGSSQASTIYVATGDMYVSPHTGQNTLRGGFVATTRQSATASAGTASGSLGASGSSVTFDSNYVAQSLTVTQNGIDANDGFVAEQAIYTPTALPSFMNYGFTQTATSAAVPSGIGTNRPPDVSSGFAAGLMQTFSVNRNSAYGDSFALAGNVFLHFEHMDHTWSDGGFAAFVGVVADRQTAALAGELEDLTLPLAYWGLDGSGSRGSYIDFDYFAARDARDPVSGEQLTQVNSQVVLPSSRALLVSSKTVDAQNQAAFAGVNFCRCEYTRWGFWSSDTFRDATTTSGPERLRDVTHLGTWVAGRPTDPALMPASGTAAFSGHVVASIKSSGSEYLAAGNFSNSVDFGTGIGNVAVTGLDGRNYNGTVQHFTGSSFFGGTIAGSGAGAPSMNLLGQFYDGPLGHAREMGGRLTIDGGPSYIGSGIFAASR